jgi:pilus assembly protein CpaF
VSREAVFEASTDFFLAPVRDFLRDDSVTEIMVNGWDQIYIERGGRLERTDAAFPDEDSLVAAINNIAQWVGRTIDASHPVLDARLPDGSRVHAIVPPTARTGVYLTIRKFSRHVMSLPELVRIGSVSAAAREFLELCVRLRKNILISGGTGTGKTSLLNALSGAIPVAERIVVIEDTSELKLHQPHTLYLEARAREDYGRTSTLRSLFVASLRMRPDRIILGEVRAGEALDMVQSMLSGHAGSLSTIHANTPRDALIRLETLSMMSDVEMPVHVARTQVASAIHLVVQIARFAEDGSRRVTHVSEVCGLGSDDQYLLRDLFASRYHGKERDGRLRIDLEPTGDKPTFADEPRERGMADQIRESQALWTI